MFFDAADGVLNVHYYIHQVSCKVCHDWIKKTIIMEHMP